MNIELLTNLSEVHEDFKDTKHGIPKVIYAVQLDVECYICEFDKFCYTMQNGGDFEGTLSECIKWLQPTYDIKFNEKMTALKQDFLERPNAYWAKKFDTVAHIPTKDYRTHCGSHAALLGNNYAPYLRDICEDCVRSMIKAQE